MYRFLTILCIVLAALGVVSIYLPEGTVALLVVLFLSSAAVALFRHFTDEREFITKIFLAALAVRLAFGVAVHIFGWRTFFGGDANTYNFRGARLLDIWLGHAVIDDPDTVRMMSVSSPGWGMNYLVAFLYLIFGRNILAAQSFCAVIGAATAPMVYFCARKIFQNIRVAKLSAVAVAFFPAFIIWSSQLLKDGLIIFLLVLAMTMVLQLQDKFNYAAIIILIASLFGILSLRFYIFYMVALAVAGSFVIGVSNSFQSIARRTVALILLGLGLTYFGIVRTASVDIERYGTLERLQSSRMDLAKSAESGFAEDVDVSTTEGAIAAIPIGFMYLMLAPFPWEVSSFRQAITLPEVLAWWAMIPLMIYGLWYAIRHKLRSAFPVLIFSLMLTLAYSIFLGNIGTAYRQRTQIQVFLFIFIAVGWTLFQERKEDRKILRQARQRRLEKALQARMRDTIR